MVNHDSPQAVYSRHWALAPLPHCLLSICKDLGRDFSLPLLLAQTFRSLADFRKELTRVAPGMSSKPPEAPLSPMGGKNRFQSHKR